MPVLLLLSASEFCFYFSVPVSFSFTFLVCLCQDFHHLLTLMTTSKSPKQPLPVVYFSQPTDPYSSSLIRAINVEPSIAVTRWFAHSFLCVTQKILTAFVDKVHKRSPLLLFLSEVAMFLSTSALHVYTSQIRGRCYCCSSRDHWRCRAVKVWAKSNRNQQTGVEKAH